MYTIFKVTQWMRGCRKRKECWTRNKSRGQTFRVQAEEEGPTEEKGGRKSGERQTMRRNVHYN